MAGIFDLHTITAIRDGLDGYLADRAAFRRVFLTVDGEETVPVDIVDQWFDNLSTSDVEVRASWMLGPPEFPVIGVRLEDTPSNHQPLGAYDTTINGVSIRGMLVDQTVAIASYIRHPELSRALRALVQAIMLDYIEWFLQVGYAEVEYLGGGDLTPEEALAVEELGQFVQTQRWRAITHTRTAGIDVSRKPVMIHATDITVDAYKGGVAWARAVREQEWTLYEQRITLLDTDGLALLDTEGQRLVEAG